MIKDNIAEIRKNIPEGVKLVCVSKFHPSESIIEAYNAGERCFGENKPQEMAQKDTEISEKIEWHFIGNLQTNKVKTVVPIAHLIHSVSNNRLLDEIEKVSAKDDKTTDILIELFVAKEESKHGFTPEEAIEILSDNFDKKYPHLRVCGVMGMASFVDNENIIRSEFKTISNTFKTIKNTLFADKSYFKEISMGMSSDYKIAIEEGSTIVRVGSSIFGKRNY